MHKNTKPALLALPAVLAMMPAAGPRLQAVEAQARAVEPSPDNPEFKQ